MLELIKNFLSLGLKPLYEEHLKYYLIVKEFREKLPRPQNVARNMSEDEKRLLLGEGSKYITGIDLSTQKISISESDLDVFYNNLNQFDYTFIIFKKYYKSYTKNLTRLRPKAENQNFDLAVLQKILDNPIKPLKPIPVLFYHIKYQYKFTSKVYMWFIERGHKK